MNAISIVLITKNTESSLEECLNSLKKFDDVIVYDNGSSDKTVEIARSYSNVKVHEGDFFGFGKTKAYAVNLSKHDWVFSLDSDETITPELAEELLTMPLDDSKVYNVRRDNFYNDRHIKCCGWYPENIVRLFNKTKTNFDDSIVHEKIEIKGLKSAYLKFPINHYSFHSVADFLVKIQSYSEIYANEHKGTKHSSISKAILRGKSMFIKSYLIKGGWKFGFEGFVISFFAGLGTTVKYLKLREKNLYDL